MQQGERRRSVLAFAWLALGGVAVAVAGMGLGIVLASADEPLRRLAYVIAGLAGLVVVLLRRDWLPTILVVVVVALEEFPTTLVYDRRFDRSLTYLYGKSLGIPGLYG